LAILGGLLLLSAPVRGASVGFKEWSKHEHPTTFDLPRIYQPVPLHVPHLSDQRLIRLWMNDQFSPIFRNARIEIQLGEAVLARRALNPERFDHEHPTLARLLLDENYFEYALSLYRSHPGRFVHYHHPLVAVIRGWAMMRQMELSGTTLVNPAPQGLNNVPPGAVPAPPSIVLLVVGLGYVARRLRTAGILPAVTRRRSR